LSDNAVLVQSTDRSSAQEVEGPPEPSRTRRVGVIWGGRAVVAAVLLIGWQLIGSTVSPLYMSYPTAVARAAKKEVSSGELFSALGSSMQTLLVGFLISIIIGLVIGLVLGRYRLVSAWTEWILNALYATPLIAVLPLVIVWFGLGYNAKLFIVVALAVFPIIINTASGVREIDDAFLDVGRAFVRSESATFRKIILPGALPYIMTGVRLAVGRALIGVVVSEFFTGISGLGAMIVKYGNNFDTAGLFVPVIVLMLLGVLLTALLRAAEKTTMRWKVR